MFYWTILHFMYHFCLVQNLENYTVLVVEVMDNWDMATVRCAIIPFFFAFNFSALSLRGSYHSVVYLADCNIISQMNSSIITFER